MTEETKKKKLWKEKLKKDWRLVIFDTETYKEVGSYHLSLLNFYIILSTIVLFVTAIVVVIIMFTPAKKLVPGYGDIYAQSEFVQLNRQIDEMEKELAAYKLYTESFQKMLTDNPETAPVDTAGNNLLEGELKDVERIEEDEILRKEMELEKIAESSDFVNDKSISTGIPLEQMYFIPPLTGEISSRFLSDKKHYGIDILAPKNTAIKSILDGWVIFSNWTLETGNTIGILHKNNTISFYKHNSINLKKAGEFVKAGEAIAIIGNTGTHSEGMHLHFELWHKGIPVDPAEYIKFN